ncbi:cytochrome o ubiquinol oxidase subunit IV [Blochmannia endosymbiont of Colobopsis nipponica]|uniref:cytochrome o ubiquinol oxidase subunit IV n=1 Tax=Blochmannia endosymbiont of Colobopsis nipponica TaxID=2681987 RepID=UPI0017802F55|nr:cytochrome o ubiquinol oxidase subunit IV [Blochmannia endosymbiont of Colobopsis nipponica]QOI11185.1 cytochrome o ubiquinol oxidase subunit IV [Blochmannia endosymbiont of Colobopsis nipponica]
MNHVKHQSYLIGFIFSLILTTIPFLIATFLNYNRSISIALLILCAIIQITIHLICFLHLNKPKKQKWNFISLIFTILITTILITGSLWIMNHLSHNLMHH